MKASIKYLLEVVGIFTVVLVYPFHFGFAQNDTREALPPNNTSQEAGRYNHKISGQAFFMPDSLPFADLKISFSDVGETVVAEDGSYEMEVPRHWSGTAIPYLCDSGGYVFEPPFYTYDDVVFNKKNQDFSGESDTSYFISGRFLDKTSGEPIANTQFTFHLSGGNNTGQIQVTTNDSGEYSVERLPCWSGTLDPFLQGYYYFEPVTRSYDELSSIRPGQDYEVLNYEYPIPTGWETINTGSPAFISVDINSNPDICGTPLLIGDLVGVFYFDDEGLLKCGGSGIWQEENNAFVIAQGDDNTTTVKDGFVNFEEYNWKVYSQTEQTDFPAEIELSSGTNSWSKFNLTKVDEVDAYFEHSIQILAGWSGLSSYTNPGISPPFITTLMDPIINDLVIVQTLQKVYYPDGGVNNLILWTYDEGYKIKVSGDVELPMNGCPKSSKTINLSPTWNLIPVLSPCDVPVQDFFAPILDKLILVKEVAGTGIYWPEVQVQTLNALKAGSAYLVAVSGNTSLTFEPCMAERDEFETKLSSSIDLGFTAWNVPKTTGSSHAVLLKSEALSDFDTGDYFGAFTPDGICRGMCELSGECENTVLTIFGDDVFTSEKDGFLDGEEILFKVYQNSSGDVLSARATFDNSYYPSCGQYFDNGISAVTEIDFMQSGIISPIRKGMFYPNPTSGLVNFEMDSQTILKLTIQNLEGQVVFEDTIPGNQQLDVSFLRAGVYVITLESDNIYLIDKLILK